MDTQVRLRHAARGGWHMTRARAAPLLNSDGSVRGWVGMNNRPRRAAAQAAQAPATP